MKFKAMTMTTTINEDTRGYEYQPAGHNFGREHRDYRCTEVSRLSTSKGREKEKKNYVAINGLNTDTQY